MADHSPDSFLESVTEKITNTFHADSASDSDDDVDNHFSVSSVKNDIYRIFGRDKPIHKVLGGGKAADIFLWRRTKVTGAVVGAATAVWLLFEVLQYHLVTLVCHLVLLGLAANFLSSRASSFINKSLPQIPEIFLPEDIVLDVAGALTTEINRAVIALREIALGKDLKKFFSVIAGLWIISVLGSAFSFLTLCYIAFILLHTMPMLYEKYEDQVDAYAEKAEAEIKKQYAVFEAKYLSKLPVCPLKGKLA